MMQNSYKNDTNVNANLIKLLVYILAVWICCRSTTEETPTTETYLVSVFMTLIMY